MGNGLQCWYGVDRLIVAVATAPSTRKVAVLGTATSTLFTAPVNDPSWEVWACSPWMMDNLPPRADGSIAFDKFFEIHWNSQFYPSERETFLPWMANCGKPVYVFDDLGLPNQVFYPKQRIEADNGSAFFTSTIAWMLALAIDERPTDIGIWGVDMADDTEYSHQKQGCLHFIALARLLGINIVLPKGSELLNVPLPYPDRYGTKTAVAIRNQRNDIEAHLKELQDNLALFKEAEAYTRGQVDLIKILERKLV